MSIYPEDDKKEPQVIHPITEEFNEDQRKLVKQLVEAMGVTELSDRTTRLENTMESVITKLDQVIQVSNNMVNALNQGQQPSTNTIGSATQAPMSGMEKIQALGEFLKHFDPLIEKYIRPPQVQNSIIDPEYINEKVRNSIMGNFEVGEALIGQLKSKITSKAIGQVVKDIVTHEPA